MGFLSLWPLALLLLVVVIILLYILRQETTQREFSSTFLWQEMLRNNEATKPWEKLRKNILLFLQILTVLLIMLAMMGPWIKGLGQNEQCVVLVIDNSASMGSMYSDSQTRLEAAKDAACDYIDDASAGASVYLISGNKQAVLELANSTDKLEAKNRVNSIEQTEVSGDMSVTLGLVQSCAAKSENPDIVFFTDTAFDLGGIEAAVASFYSEGLNLSVDGISYAWNEDKLLVLSQLTNYSDEAVSREVNIYGIDASNKETMLDIVKVDVAALDVASVYAELPKSKLEGVTAIKAEINEADMLAGDNTCWCVLDERRESKVLLVSKSNMFIEKAFENLAGVEIARTDDISVVDGDKEYDLYIFDGKVPDTLPEKGNILFINCEFADVVKASGAVESKLLKLTESELTEYVSETEIGVNSSLIYDVPAWASSYIQAEEGSAGIYGIYDGRKIATIGFDLHQTDFGLQAEFPVLMSNISGYLLNGNLTESSSYVAGASIMLHGSTKGSDLTLTMPGGNSQTVEASESSGSYLEVDDTGIYSVSQELNDTTKWQQFAVQYPSALESNVESAQSMLGPQGLATEANIHKGVLELRNYIIAILILLLIAEWIIYIRLQ